MKEREEEDNLEETINNEHMNANLPDDLPSEDNFINGSMFANLCVFIGFAVFAFTVNYVLKAVSPEDNEMG